MRAHLKRSSTRRPRLSAPAAFAVGATLLFVAISIWWLLYDKRVPGNGDPGRHLSITLALAELLRDGDVGGVLGFEANWGPDLFYPPLVHFVGAIPAAFGLEAQSWGTIALNLVFVPMLAAGCYGVGRLVYGPAAGALAAIFALGTPIVLSMFHIYLLDAPLAATVAIALWALLTSERFERTGASVLAGALLGAALLVKAPAALFLAGPIAVMLLGGGWRHWRNFALFAAAALIVAGPYYLINLSDVLETSEGTTITLDPAGNTGEPASFDAEQRFSLENLAWYGWTAVNVQYFVPLLCLFAVGFVAAIREIRMRRHLPELLAGLVVGYLALTLVFSIRDPRYTIPLVVYVAVISTGWITVVRRPAIAAVATAVLAGAVVLNVGAQTVGGVPTVSVSVPGDEQTIGDATDPGAFTLIDDRGYWVGPARGDPLWDRLFSAAEREGVESARVYIFEAPQWGTDALGFDVLAAQHDISSNSLDPRPSRPELKVTTTFTEAGYYRWIATGRVPPPCGTIEEGTTPPPDSDPVTLRVSVERLGPDGYRRWCDF